VRRWIVCTALLAAVVAALAFALLRPDEGREEDARPRPPSSARVRWVDEHTGEVIFTSREIVRFDWERQIFELRRERAMDLMSRPLGLMRAFVVRDEKGELYRGCFMSSLSSHGYDGPTITSYIPFPGSVRPPLYRIYGGYPRGGGKRDGERFHPRLRAALEAAGLLAEISDPSAVVPIERVYSGWHGGGHGIRIYATLFPETVRIGREARFILRVARAPNSKMRPEDWSWEISLSLQANGGKYGCSQSIEIPTAAVAEGVYVYRGKMWGPVKGLIETNARPGAAELSLTLIAHDADGSRKPRAWTIPPQQVIILDQ